MNTYHKDVIFLVHFTDKNIVSDLEKGKNTLAMACVDVYSRAGAEGQLSHSENSISRTYDSSWIKSLKFGLISQLCKGVLEVSA